MKFKTIEKISIGDTILIDKGIAGTDRGIILKISCPIETPFTHGIYISEIDKQEHIFDLSVHKIGKINI